MLLPSWANQLIADSTLLAVGSAISLVLLCCLTMRVCNLQIQRAGAEQATARHGVHDSNVQFHAGTHSVSCMPLQIWQEQLQSFVFQTLRTQFFTEQPVLLYRHAGQA